MRASTRYTDIADTDIADTDIADTDITDTDIADTDIADTDIAEHTGVGGKIRGTTINAARNAAHRAGVAEKRDIERTLGGDDTQDASRPVRTQRRAEDPAHLYL
ncbi:hypothetical protein N7495_001613 [Penicillium taxi]|uniref:uncharacterized protein n=1 Tax=Penicillium taxi TaxID=168475 RepID=UPI0025450F06|nr:uncharacterized protein N7495_001613 [Penicillium taxi]KAJ5908931.1 hypothetical protein N7495_001613 [Penicillium taxi]